MSLKAKLEAVIYAAEEPVTLAQLAAIFAEDAFAWKAEQEARNRELALRINSVDTYTAIDAAGLSDSSQELSDLIDAVEQVPEWRTSVAQLGEEYFTGNTGGTEVPNLPATASLSEPAAESIDPELEARRAERRRERDVREILRGVLDDLIAEYAEDSRGIEIREIAGGFRMGTKPEIHDAVRAFVKSLKPPMKLSLPALETLAVIAYKQPVTAPEVGEIRGVDSAGVLGSLLSRKLISTAGRKQVIGRPILYKTTKEFLLRFGLKDLNELPSMEEFEKMAALELNEESLDGESIDFAEPRDLSGDLFDGLEAAPPETIEEATETFIPTAEPLQEAAEAHALVERLNAEEVEVEQ